MMKVKWIVWCFFIFFVTVSCEDKVKEFSGFTQKELEYLLSSEEGKAWERIAREEGESEVELTDCEMDNFLIFGPGDLGGEKALLYAYNPLICDSLDFCDLHPDFCQADTMNCNANPEFCELLSGDVLFIGSWYAKQPFIDNARSDTLVMKINNKLESVFVTSITSQYATFQYKNRTGGNGEIVTEYYKFTP